MFVVPFSFESGIFFGGVYYEKAACCIFICFALSEFNRVRFVV